MRGLLFYTISRLMLFVAVWLILQAVTPLRGLTAIVVALLVSGAIAFFLLNRQRDSASASVVGMFRRIDERIERSRSGEDAEQGAADQPATSDPKASPPPSSTP